MIETPLEYYKPTRKSLEEARTRESGKLDQIIFIIATGAFVLSINFLANTSTHFKLPYLLVIAWLMLLFAIISQAASYLFAGKRIIHAINQLDQWYETGFAKKRYAASRKYQRRLQWSNRVALFSLSVGVIALTLFISYNFININNQNMSDKQDSKQLQEEIKAVDINPRPYKQPEKDASIKLDEKKSTDGK